MLPIEYLYTYTRGNSSIEGPLAVLSIGVRGKRSAKVQNQQLFRANIILHACASMKKQVRSSLFVIRHADINGQAAKALPAPVNKNPVWRKQRKLKMCKALIKENLEA